MSGWTPKHTPEPWTYFPQAGDAYEGDFNRYGDRHGRKTVFHTPSDYEFLEEARANGARIVSCVNALAGIPNPEGVGDFIKVVKASMPTNEPDRLAIEAALRAMGLEVGE